MLDGGTEETMVSVHRTVWVQITLSQVRRMPQRGQSRQSTGTAGSGALTVSGEGEASKNEEESGHNTELTQVC
jgi:hypothetical protein